MKWFDARLETVDARIQECVARIAAVHARLRKYDDWLGTFVAHILISEY